MLSVKRSGGQIAACLVAITAAHCGQTQAPEPSIPPAQASCGDPMPPPLRVVTRSGDPATCLSEGMKQRGLVVTMFVGRDGRATSVAQWAYLCAPVDPKGPGLSMDEAACVTNTILSWRFAAFDTCATQFAYIGVPAQPTKVGCPGRVGDFEVNWP